MWDAVGSVDDAFCGLGCGRGLVAVDGERGAFLGGCGEKRVRRERYEERGVVVERVVGGSEVGDAEPGRQREE